MRATRLEWLRLFFLRYYRNMGLRVLLYALLSLVATLAAPFVNPIVDPYIDAKIDFSSVVPVLTILATSMLAVSTFSLNIMVTAHRAAADLATPRVHQILLEDMTTQSVLAVFIGAFVYSLGSLILFRIGFYPEDAALVVMGITILVVIAVVISLLRWIDHLTMLGSLENSLHAAKTRAEESLRAQAEKPCFGAVPLTEETVLPTNCTQFLAPETGYLQLIDMALLEKCLPETSTLYVLVSPGEHVLAGELIGYVSRSVDDNALQRLSQAFTFGTNRTHEQDTEFGLIVLSEIASKALSPGVNDTGTAIEAIVILKSLLWSYAEASLTKPSPDFPRVVARFANVSSLAETAFGTIARDGAGKMEVALCLRRSLAALSMSESSELSNAACDLANLAMCYSRDAGIAEPDVSDLESITVCQAP